MAHSDDKGLVLPPRMAPVQVVIVPIWSSDEQKQSVLAYVEELRGRLEGRVDYHVDDRDQLRPGWKYAEWELRGIPIRLEVGPRDLEKRGAVLVRRDQREKQTVSADDLVTRIVTTLETMQQDLFRRSLEFRTAHTTRIDDYAEFQRYMKEESGFAWAPWCGVSECETRVAEETKATIRTVPFGAEDRLATPGAPPPEEGRCIACQGVSPQLVLWGKAY
jgi:prolyl-tRNA synthetase